MRLDIHAVVQNAPNSDQVGPHCPIQQKMSRLANQAGLRSGTITAVAQMEAAHHRPKFWPRRAAGAVWIRSNISQASDQQHLVAAPRCIPEPFLGVGKDLDDVFLGGRRQPKARQRLLAGGPNPLLGSTA